MKTLKFEIYGRVQGVNLRNNIKDYAKENNIFGYVRNLEDGSVEVIAQASEETLKKFERWLRKSPGFSRVKYIFKEELDDNKIFNEFRILTEENFFIDKAKSIKTLEEKY